MDMLKEDRLVPRSRLHAGAGAGLCRPVPEDLQGVSAAPEGGELQSRSGYGEAVNIKWFEVIMKYLDKC